MKVEWAWLRDTGVRHSQIREIDLRRDGPCVVLLLHGLTGGPTEFAYVANLLHYRGRMTVMAPALVNHGQPVVVLARTRWTELWESARTHFLRARDHARERGVPLFVGGLSMGAVLSLMLAAEFPGDVAGVASLSPTLFHDGWCVPARDRFLLWLSDYMPWRNFVYLREGDPYGLHDEQLRAAMREKYSAAVLDDTTTAFTTYAHFPLRLLCEYHHLVAHARTLFPDVTAPVLAVQSLHDDSAGPANTRYILDHIRSTDRRLLLLEQSYHIVTADLEREKVAEAMREFFLERCGSPEKATACHSGTV